jgi:hypothetical protein
MSFLLLIFSVVFVGIMYRLGRIGRLQTATTSSQ